jgi:hypothetical protein
LQLLFRQVASVHPFQTDFVIDERVGENPAVIFRHDNDHAECLHELGRRIFIAAAFRAQIGFKIRDEHVGNFFQGDVLDPVLGLHECFQTPHTTVVFGVSRRTFADTDQFLHVFVVRAEQFQ